MNPNNFISFEGIKINESVTFCEFDQSDQVISFEYLLNIYKSLNLSLSGLTSDSSFYSSNSSDKE